MGGKKKYTTSESEILMGDYVKIQQPLLLPTVGSCAGLITCRGGGGVLHSFPVQLEPTLRL